MRRAGARRWGAGRVRARGPLRRAERGEVPLGVLLAGLTAGALLTGSLFVLLDGVPAERGLSVVAPPDDAPRLPSWPAPEPARARPRPGPEHPVLALDGSAPPRRGVTERLADLEARLEHLERALGGPAPGGAGAGGRDVATRIARLEARLDASGLPDPEEGAEPTAWQGADHLARDLGLEPGERAAVTEVIAAARHELEQVLGTKGEGGVSPYEAALTTIETDGGAQIRILGWNPRLQALLATRIPGRGETYVQAQARIAGSMRAALRRVLSREAWERYVALDDGPLLPVLAPRPEDEDAGED